MHSFTDMIGTVVNLPQIPRRIVSVVPSQTELLYHLGLEEEVIGITKFCVHPQKWFSTKNRVGGTKQLHIEKIKALNPDLIIANKEENVKEQIEELRSIAPVWTSDISTLADNSKMIEHLGEILQKEEEAKKIIHNINSFFIHPEIANLLKGKKVLYLIWKNPWMSVGNDTFIHHLLTQMGAINCLKETTRYPEIEENDNAWTHADYVFLSSEPYPFKAKEQLLVQQLAPQAKVILVDGEMFSWYGSRLTFWPEYLKAFKELL